MQLWRGQAVCSLEGRGVGAELYRLHSTLLQKKGGSHRAATGTAAGRVLNPAGLLQVVASSC